MVKSDDPIALAYFGKSVLEQHHVSVFNEILELKVGRTSLNIFEKTDPDAAKRIREMVTAIILNTDMAGHSKLLEQFKEIRVKLNQNGESITSTDKTTLVSYFVHCMDLGNTMQKRELENGWKIRIAQEFQDQFDAEVKLLGKGNHALKYVSEAEAS